jgi:uncharacterized coiled-coil protein SlyX
VSSIPPLDSLHLADVPATQIGGIIAAGLLFLRWLLGMAGARQDARIAKLEGIIAEQQKAREELDADRLANQQSINNKLMALAQGMMELMSAVEKLDDKHIALARARKTLAEVFPVEGRKP